MNLRFIFIGVLYLCLWAGCSDNTLLDIEIKSPNGNLVVDFAIGNKGIPSYAVSHKNILLIDTSTLGFKFKDDPDLWEGMRLISYEISEFDEIWEMPWGEQRFVRNHYKYLKLFLVEQRDLKRKLNLVFRVYNDGIGFRYEFPEQEGFDEVTIMEEETEFRLTGDHTCWWIPGDWDIYEHLYNTTKFSEIAALSKANHPSLAQSYIPENSVNTPVTMKTEEGLYLSFHEAALTDYAGMTLKIDTENLKMVSSLVGSDRTGYKVRREIPFVTPWRTIQVAEKATDLIESKLIVNLNEPNELGDVSWFEPTKYMGIWWEMHLGKSSWDMASGRHGATTENAKRHIDFASKNEIGALLVEGWNTGWENWIGIDDREGIFDFVTPYPDYNIEEVVSYGKEKGVDIIMHHETSAAISTYENQLDTAFSLMKRLGMNVVKTGYVGKIIPKGEYHHGQWMVNHYRKVLMKAAEYNVAVNAHEPIKATGIRRTYPNAVSREGLRGQEFNAWSSDGGNPPEHLPIVAFTRMLAGPIDYTPGIFNIKLEPYKPDNQVNTTLAHQLALYVVIYSPVQMVPDLIENYEGHEAFQFIRDVGVDWDTTIVINGEVGDYVTIARKERGSESWFLGSITDENAREIIINFYFLPEGKKYEAIIYEDGKDAHWDTNPTSFGIRYFDITKDSQLVLKLAPGGGAAISFFQSE
jgi:hypothetical protein